MAWRLWRNLTTAEFRLCDKAATIVVLPISATEQHGPHLPVGTDAHICNGLLDLTRRTSPPELNVLELPMLSVCASQEHLSFPGTLSIQSADLADQITALADRICAAGFGILVIVSSHGGNVAAMTDAALRCRQVLKLLAVNLTWMRLGVPDGLISADERAFGVHGGLVETSLMLHFRPDLVAMERSENFYNLQENLANTGEILRAYGSVGFGWMAEDLNPAGVVGDAASAFADTGKQIADFQAARMITLLREITDAGTGLLTVPRK